MSVCYPVAEINFGRKSNLFHFGTSSFSLCSLVTVKLLKVFTAYRFPFGRILEVPSMVTARTKHNRFFDFVGLIYPARLVVMLYAVFNGSSTPNTRAAVTLVNCVVKFLSGLSF